MHDLRYALRSLSRSPVLSSVAVLSLALGIGANTAIFSLLDQVLLRLLPVPNPGELVNLRSPGAKPGHTYSDGDDASSFSYPMYKDLRDRQPVFTGLLARLAVPLSVAAQGQTERASGELVTGNYFQVLGVRAALGRTFTQEDDRLPGAHPLAVLSHGYWTRRFGADASVLNQPIVVNGRSLTVVGVARAGFSGVQVGQTPDVFIPMTMKAQMTPSWDGLEDRKDYWLNIIGRLKPGVPRERAAAALQTLYAPLLEMEAERSNFRGQSRERFQARKILLEPGGQGRQILQSEARDPLALLMAMVGLVLLIACANVANLLIARAAVRQKELAVRLSLGAGRGRLIRQLLLESVVLGLAGGLAGLLVASWTADSMVRLLLSGSDIRGLSADLDPRVLGFNFALAALTGLVFGLAPALRATRPNLSPVLKNQAAGVSTDSAHARFRKVLVTGQMAFTVLLLAAAGLFVESLYNLKNLDLGLRPDRLMAFSLSPALNGYSPPRTAALFERLTEALAAAPGIEAVSAAKIPVLASSNERSNITTEGRQEKEGEDLIVGKNWIGPNYFSTMGIPLVAGRELTRQDSANSQKVAVVNEAMARSFFPGRDPIGRKFALGGGTGVRPDIDIVGVVKDSRHGGVREDPGRFVYMPHSQKADLGNLTFYLRTAQPPSAVAAAVRREVARLDPNLPVFDLKTMQAQVEESIVGERIITLLSASFGVLAAVLAAIGIYGLLAFTVARRTREIGIRIALGARGGAVRWIILKEIGLLALAGAVIGLPAAYGLGRLVESLLFGVKAGDPLIEVAAAASMILVALLSAWLPARKATRIDPMTALRYE